MIVLATNNEYGVDSFFEGEKEIKIENASLYGENQTRNELKIVEVDGFLLRDIASIKVESGDFVVFKFYNSLGEIVVEYIMKIYEKLVVKNTSLGTLKYSFVR